MPIYEYKCDCGAERELDLPFSESVKKQQCECGQMMWQKFTVSINPHFKETGRDKILGTLNQEEGASDFPGGDMHRDRYEKAMAKGLNPPKQVIGRGF